MSRFEILTADQVIERLEGRKYKYAQVHHTWEPDHADFDGDNHIALQQGMKDYHINVKGWDDIGQHLTIFPDGKCVTGRDFDKIPAGISGYNTGSFMIEHIGNFDKGHDKLEGAQLEASLKIYHFLVKECGAKILFHREHAAKSCPGTGWDKNWFVSKVLDYKFIAHQEELKSETIIKLIQKGDKGQEVKELQQNLIKVGEKLPRYGADGEFGDETEYAVKAFQARHHLTVDGIAGQQTLGKLKELLTAVKVPYPGHLIKLEKPYMKENAVGLIQKRLNELGYHLKVDNTYGPKTAAAVGDFQRNHGLVADKIAGPKTWAKLF